MLFLGSVWAGTIGTEKVGAGGEASCRGQVWFAATG
jgi:hypothetical protein